MKATSPNRVQANVVRFQSNSGIVHGILRRDCGGNGRFLCGRLGDGWEYKGYARPITCRQCLSHNKEINSTASVFAASEGSP
jgi:hypothetical protein